VVISKRAHPSPGVDMSRIRSAFAGCALRVSPLRKNQRAIRHFGVMSLQHSAGALDAQTSFIAYYLSLTFTPEPLGDLMFTGQFGAPIILTP
jgi:hypothetical protein